MEGSGAGGVRRESWSRGSAVSSGGGGCRRGAPSGSAAHVVIAGVGRGGVADSRRGAPSGSAAQVGIAGVGRGGGGDSRRGARGVAQVLIAGASGVQRVLSSRESSSVVSCLS